MDLQLLLRLDRLIAMGFDRLHEEEVGITIQLHAPHQFFSNAVFKRLLEKKDWGKAAGDLPPARSLENKTASFLASLWTRCWGGDCSSKQETGLIWRCLSE